MNVKSTDYAVGTYGPFSVDRFTKNDTQKLILTLTVEGWPDVPEAVRATVMFFDPDQPDPETGVAPMRVGGGTFTWPGRPLDWDGSVLAQVHAEVQVPRLGDDKATVAEGSVTLEALVPVRTAVAFNAA